jgi:hypothetical protein
VTDHALDPASPAVAGDLDHRYLDMLKGCLTRDLFPEGEFIDQVWWKPTPFLGEPEAVWEFLLERNWRLVRRVQGEDLATMGKDFIPSSAETMVGRARLDNVEELVRTVLAEGVPGDLVETGVWRGGTVIFMRAILATYGITDRTVWACDSFEGLPEPDAEAYPADEAMQVDDAKMKLLLDAGLAVSVEQVRANFARYGLLDDQVRFVEGWFSESLPTAPIEQIAVLRLDGDLYESTMDALVNLEPKVAPGGFVIIDDYGSLEPCRKAVHDYRDQHGIDDPIETVDWTGAYWRTTRA